MVTHQLGYFIALHTVAHHGFKRMNPNTALRDKGFREMAKPQCAPLGHTGVWPFSEYWPFPVARAARP